MAKKKDKPQVINNIQELNLEIDYDKLAEAIVKAQNMPIVKDDTEDKESFLDQAMKGKIPQGKLFPLTLSKLMKLFFYILAVVSIFFVLHIVYSVVDYGFFVGWNNEKYLVKNINHVLFAVSLIVLDFIFVTIIFNIGYEIGRERDKNYIISAFSSVIGLVALIVALVALFKGVG